MGWRPTGSSFSCVGPAIGRLMFANRPPLALFHVQTLGGMYSLIFLYSLFLNPGWRRASDSPRVGAVSAIKRHAPIYGHGTAFETPGRRKNGTVIRTGSETLRSSPKQSSA